MSTVLVAGTLPGLLSAQAAPPAVTPRAALGIVGSEAMRAVELFDLRRRDAQLSTTDVYQGVWLRERGAPDSVVFDLLPFASAPRDHAGLALAYDGGLGTRMWAGAAHPDPLASALQGSAARMLLGAWRALSPAQERLPARSASCPNMSLRLGGEMVHGFGTDGRDAPPDTRALLLYADCDRDLASSWRLRAGLRGYAWRTPGEPDRHDVESMLQVARAPPGNTLLVFLDLSWTPQYRRGVLHLERPFDLGRSHLRPILRLARGDGLPFGLGFWPGGIDGFPGIPVGARRGDREATLALDASQPIAGPVSLRGMVAVGRTANGGSLLAATHWLAGARAGVNVATRIGLVRLEYGRATNGHGAVLVRIGHLW